MPGKLARYLSLSVALAAPLGAARREGPAPAVTIFVYNYAAIQPEVLAATKSEAGRILWKSGVKTEWLDCPLTPKEAAAFPACHVEPGPTRLAVRILPQAMVERMQRARDCFGFALHPEDGSFAAVANVFAHLAAQIAGRHGMRHGVVLGHIVAHELGHLLLGEGSHSGGGIMHVPWLAKELERVAQGTMRFTGSESRKMRANTAARMAAAGSPANAVARQETR
jgi:hypothetical protein